MAINVVTGPFFFFSCDCSQSNSSSFFFFFQFKLVVCSLELARTERRGNRPLPNLTLLPTTPMDYFASQIGNTVVILKAHFKFLF